MASAPLPLPCRQVFPCSLLPEASRCLASRQPRRKNLGSITLGLGNVSASAGSSRDQGGPFELEWGGWQSREPTRYEIAAGDSAPSRPACTGLCGGPYGCSPRGPGRSRLSQVSQSDRERGLGAVGEPRTTAMAAFGGQAYGIGAGGALGACIWAIEDCLTMRVLSEEGFGQGESRLV